MRLRHLAGVCALAASAAGAQDAASSRLDFSAAGRQFRAWLAVFNAGKPEDMRRFLLTQAPSQYDVYERMVALRLRTGGFDPKKVVLAKDTRVTLLMQERGSDQFAGITLDVEPWSPHRITRLAIGQLERPGEFPIARLSDAQLIDSVRARLADTTVTERFSGALLIAKYGREIFAGAAGLADREHDVANTPDTRFRLGTMARMFTALAVLQLVQSGKIDLHAPLVRYVPDYPNVDVARRVSIHHLLTHSAGLGDAGGPRFNAQRQNLQTLDDYIRVFGQDSLAFEPGTRSSTSNLGYIVLGKVIEAVSGQSYDEYLRQYVFQPAGMTSTSFAADGGPGAAVATGYMRLVDGGPWTPNSSTLPVRATSASGGVSTVRDLLRFANALSGFTLLDADYVDLLTTRKSEARASSYAYGFFDVDTPAGRRIGHPGGGRGINGDFEIFPVSGYLVVVLANLDPPAARSIAEYVFNRLSTMQP
jgi:CubicO group peptidase (beta-lactamase class C family)